MFKFYWNRKTNHSSISLKSGDKKRWHNLEVTHRPTQNHSYIMVIDPSPKGKSYVYVRKYVRLDKHKIKGFLYKKYRLDKKSEKIIKQFLKQRKR